MEFGLVVLWLLAFFGLGLAALPCAMWLLPGTDASAFSIPLALAVIGVVGHLVGHVAFGWPALLAGVAVLLILSGLVLVRTDVGADDIDVTRVSEHALVFAVGFALVVVIRGIDPAAAPLPVSIGEKFLDFGLLNTLDRSETLPPESMWFAGESVRYYYGGQMLTALLATLTATSTAYAYNLALAGFYATLLTAAYGLATSIARPYDVSRRVAGMLGAFFVGIAANLETTLRLGAWLLPDGPAESLVTAFGLESEVADWRPGQFYYFDASRVIPTHPENPDSFPAATEFPLFAWLNGDLHAHMLSQPLVLLAAAILLAFWRTPSSHRRLLLFGVLPPLVGLVGFVNMWSLPTVLGLTALAVFFSPDSPLELLPHSVRARVPPDAQQQTNWTHPVTDELIRLVCAGVVTLVVLFGSVLWTLPFWTSVILGGPGQSVEYWSQWTPLGPTLVVIGAFLAAIMAYIARAVWATDDRVRPLLGLATGGFVVTLGVLIGIPVVALALVLVLVGWWLLRHDTVGFETMLVVAGAGLILVVEVVNLEGERFNVIFKPYVEVWLFWAVASAVALARLTSGWPAIANEDINRRQLRQTGTVLAVVLVVVTVPYAGLALTDHVSTGTETTDEVGTTLDATAFVEVHYPGEAAAIRWLESQSGQPTILTGAPAGYNWIPADGDGSAAPSSLTGIPTVAGWTHEAQYRGDAVYNERVDDVWTMYGGERDDQRTLLAAYDVEYIYVGPAEENAQFEITVDELDAVTVAESWDDVTMYQVDHDRL